MMETKYELAEAMRMDPELLELAQTSAVDPKSMRNNIDEEDKRQPRVFLMQGLSEFVSSGQAQIGDIVHNADSFVYARAGRPVTFIPVHYWKSRTLREKLDDGMGRVVCESHDSVLGVGTPGGTCKMCTMSQWLDGLDDNGNPKRTPPRCDASHNFLVFFPDLGIHDPHAFAIISFRRTSYGTGTKLINNLMGLSGHFYLYAFRLVSRQTGEGKTKWWMFELAQHDDGSKRYECQINKLYPQTYKEIFRFADTLCAKAQGQYGVPGGQPVTPDAGEGEFRGGDDEAPF